MLLLKRFDGLLEILIKTSPLKEMKSEIWNGNLYQKSQYNMIKK